MTYKIELGRKQLPGKTPVGVSKGRGAGRQRDLRCVIGSSNLGIDRERKQWQHYKRKGRRIGGDGYEESERAREEEEKTGGRGEKPGDNYEE